MHRMRPRLRAPLLVGVGAAFDFHAGLVPQAPALDAAQRPGVDLPARARAAPAVASLRPLQPPLRGRLRAPVPARAPLTRAVGPPSRETSPLVARCGSRRRPLASANLLADDASAEHTADVSVVGLGRVGLPLALSFADRGLRVLGIDNDPARLDAVRDGADALPGDRRPGAARAGPRERAGLTSSPSASPTPRRRDTS